MYILLFCLLVCLMGMAYHQCSWNLSCSDITGVRGCKDQSPCTSGCFCSDGTVLKDGMCSNTSSCSGSYIFDSCNMGMSDLPDMYAQSPRAEGIHIRQIKSAHVTTIM